MKLIQLPCDGPYVPADSIRRITGPYYVDEWFYTIGYIIKGVERWEFHTVKLSTTFVTSEEKAVNSMNKFVDRLNTML